MERLLFLSIIVLIFLLFWIKVEYKRQMFYLRSICILRCNKKKLNDLKKSKDLGDIKNLKDLENLAINLIKNQWFLRRFMKDIRDGNILKNEKIFSQDEFYKYYFDIGVSYRTSQTDSNFEDLKEKLMNYLLEFGF